MNSGNIRFDFRCNSISKLHKHRKTMRSMFHFGVCLAVILTISISSHAAGGIDRLAPTLSSESISGEGYTEVEGEDTYVMWEGIGLSEFMIEGEAIDLTLYSSNYQSVQNVFRWYEDFDKEPYSFQGNNILTLTRMDSDMELLVAPISGHTTRISNEGDFFATPIDKKTIMWDKASGGDDRENGFKIDVESINEYVFRGVTGTVIHGDFQLYVWEADFEINHDDGTDQFETGYERSTTGPGDAIATREYTHAIINVTNGMAWIESRDFNDSPRVYASELIAESDGPITYERAEGTIPSIKGLYRAPTDGNVVVEGGKSAWTFNNGAMSTAFLEPATKVTGAEIAEEPKNGFVAVASTLAPLIAAGMLVVLVVGAFAAPNVVAKNGQADGSWRHKRAKGYLMLAERAKEQSRLQLAATMVSLSRRNNRRDPDCISFIATIHSDRGDHERALKARRRVHHMLTERGLPDPEKVADNAYQAARAASALDMKDRGLHWLKVAISYNPDLADEARWEVDFDLISLEPEFKVLVGERVDLGWNPPST